MRSLRIARMAVTVAAAAFVLAGPPPRAGEEAPAASGGEAHLAPRGQDPRGYPLGGVDPAKRILWGGWCQLADGSGLLFGGADQGADDGNPHTQVRQNGAWVAIHQELRAKNPLQKLREQVWALRTRQKNAAAKARHIYFKGLPAAEEGKKIQAELLPALEGLGKDLDTLIADLKAQAGTLKDYEAGQAGFALALVEKAGGSARTLAKSAAASVSAGAVKELAAAQISLEKAAEALDAEPPPRALSPVAYDAKTKLFVIFGGDHLDYLTCDLWTFDPAQRKWTQRHPKSAPPPRANHLLKAAGDGRVEVAGGYTYANRAEYCAGEFKDVGNGPWTYDLAADAWTGGGAGVPADSRTYRSGPYHPDFFLQGPKPSSTEQEARLKALPANAWADLKPAQTLMLNRDWGTAVLDTDRDMILRWSGGHSAHGGTDVPHYHLATNRWELAHPIEFPLGQLYSNTTYPAGWNFNPMTLHFSLRVVMQGSPRQRGTG
jgi:hypothetical protein